MRRMTNMVRKASETECEREWVRDCLLVDESSLCMPTRERERDRGRRDIVEGL